MPKNRIAELRRDHDMNQRELGEKLGVAQTTISAWERGQNEPDNAALYKMSKMFYASIEYIMGYGADDFKQGLTLEQCKELQQKREQERWERRQYEEEVLEIERAEEREREKIIREVHQDEYKTAEKPDTFEGYMASLIIDRRNKEQREKLLEILEKIADIME